MISILTCTNVWTSFSVSMVEVSIGPEVILPLGLVVSILEELIVLLLIILMTDSFLPFLKLSLHLFLRVLSLRLFLLTVLLLFFTTSISSCAVIFIHVLQVFLSQSVTFSLGFQSLVRFLNFLESQLVTSCCNVWVILLDKSQVYRLELRFTLNTLTRPAFLSEEFLSA